MTACQIPAVVLVLALLLCIGMPVRAQESWPALPESDGEVVVPAQQWPRSPGPRTIQVYIRYPGGALANVTPATGLMLSLHNWGGTGWTGTADPVQLANRYNLVAICVDYVQSGPYGDEGRAIAPYDFGYFQALDALRALYCVFNGLDELGRPFARGRIYVSGGSGGGNVTLMANKLAPRTFACAIDKCGMAKLTENLAFGWKQGTGLDAGYSADPESPFHLTRAAQAIRFVGNPEHAVRMKELGNTAKLIVVHGVDDGSCPVADAREMVANMQAAGLDVEPHFITDAEVDGDVFTSTGHSMGDRTRIVFHVADAYLLPDSPDALSRSGKTDFECRDERVQYRTPGGTYIISYEAGYPVGRFERHTD
ncbi:MAG: DUF2920 family protein [Candidatus Hydrogenedentes bacterium]|nr:DUF2920 family protein [Candidatus Hydrogenedentota bacterium]